MTKPYIKDAMVDAIKYLSKKKPIPKITITEIANECEVSKQTFYNHFEDKNDLIQYACRSDGDRNLKESIRSDGNYKKAIMSYYESVIADKDFYISLVREPDLQIMLLNCVENNSINYVKKQIAYCHGKSELTPTLNLAVEFNGAGNAKLLVDWIIDNMSISPEIMADANFVCIPEPLKNYFDFEKVSRL